jgi:hypothetical protein
VVVRIPWFYETCRGEIDGEAFSTQTSEIEVPLKASELALFGGFRSDTPPLSYGQAVDDYKAEYRRRYANFLRTGDR